MGEIPKEKQAEFEKFKAEGYKNPDGSSFNPSTGVFTRSEKDPELVKDPKIARSYKPVSLEAAFSARQEGYKPFVEAAAEAVKAETAAAKTEVKTEAAAAKVELKTGMSLEGLKEKIQGDFTRLLDEVKLKFANNLVQKDFILDKNFDAAKTSTDAVAAVDPQLAASLTDYLNAVGNEALSGKMREYFKGASESITNNDIGRLLSAMYSASAKSSLDKKFKEMRLGEFAQKAELSYPMRYAVTFNNDELVSTVSSTSTDPDFKTAHEKFLKDNPVPTKESAEVEAADKARLDRAKKLKSSFAGKMMSFMGIINVGEAPEGETPPQKELRENMAYADALKGNNFIAKWFIFIFGGGAMIDGGVADIEDSMKDMDSKYKGMLTNLQTMAGNSPLSLKKMGEQLAAPVAAILALDKGKFGEALKDATKIPEKGFTLNEGFDGVAGQKLVVTLKDGAEMILPKGKSIRANDKEENANEKDDKGVEKDRSFKDIVLNITGPIPAGTVFKGKVQFKQEKIGG